LAEKAVTKQNPVKVVVNSILYTILSFINLPYKMKLLDSRIQEYQRRLNKLEKIINGHPDSVKKGSKFNTLR